MMESRGKEYPLKGDALTNPQELMESRLYRIFYGREPKDSGPVHLTNYEALILKLEQVYESNKAMNIAQVELTNGLQKRLKKIRKAIKGI